MSQSIHSYILSRLQQRKAENDFRSLTLPGTLVDFTSNNYLGLANDPALQRQIVLESSQAEQAASGSTGSRLLSGNSAYAENLEMMLAAFHQGPAALLFNSGFDANYGLLSSLPYKGDTILYDELVHASIHDGIRSSKAGAISFAHNRLDELELKLRKASGRKYVVVESVYSMNGDLAPLQEIANLCDTWDAGLIVDEAHATGILGPQGKGLVVQLNLQNRVLARVHTFGKAIGAHGAVIICHQDLKDFLINYCRPFIFSTALPLHTLVAVKCAYDLLQQDTARRAGLNRNIQLFKEAMKGVAKFCLLPGNSAIQSVVIPGNEAVKAAALAIQQQGLDVRPILYPTVPKGEERIRICLHSFNTEAEILKLVQAIRSL